MDPTRFEPLVRSHPQTGIRRWAVARLQSALPLGSALAVLSGNDPPLVENQLAVAAGTRARVRRDVERTGGAIDLPLTMFTSRCHARPLDPPLRPPA